MTSQPQPQGPRPYPLQQPPAESRGQQARRKLYRDACTHRDQVAGQLAELDQLISRAQSDREDLAAVLGMASETVSRYEGGLPAHEQRAAASSTPQTGVWQAPELAGDPDTALKVRPSQARDAVSAPGTQLGGEQ